MQDGDVVRFDYTLRVAGESGVLDTSMQDVAEREGILRPDRTYAPLTVVLGQREIVPGLEAHLREHGHPDESVTAELEPSVAYGERDAKLIRDIPMAEFRKQKVKPEVGMRLNLGDRPGTVVRVAGGRVRVDANHELAGKTLHYEYVVREVVRDESEKVRAVVSHILGEGAVVRLQGETVELEVPDQARFDKNWMMAKFRVVGALRAVTGEKRDVRLVETYPADLGQGHTHAHEHTEAVDGSEEE